MATLTTSHPDTQSSGELLVSLVEQMQDAFGLFPPAERLAIAVGVSGGVDSVCLLHLLAALAPAWCLDLHIAHVDHALRLGSAEDMALVRDHVVQLHLPFYTLRLDGAALRADPAGVEAAARRERYRFLCAVAINVAPADQVPIVVVAHHARDQAETLLMRLIQGSGLRGLSAMRPIMQIEDSELAEQPVRLVRPLLSASREAIIDFAIRHQLTWREDESNVDVGRSRNLVRHQVLPLLARINPQVIDAVARTAFLLADDAERLRGIDQETMQRLVTHQDGERVLLALNALQELSASEVRGVLRIALDYLGADLRAIGSNQLAALASTAGQQRRLSGPHPLAGPLAWSVVADLNGMMHLALHRAHALPMVPPGPWLDAAWQHRAGTIALPTKGKVECGDWTVQCNTVDRNQLSYDWRHNTDRWSAFFDADAAMAPRLTTPGPGLMIDPLGMAGSRKHVGDLFTDAKISTALRKGWPVVVNDADGGVLWVCGLAQSHAARVTPHTQRVWYVQWHRRSNQ